MEGLVEEGIGLLTRVKKKRGRIRWEKEEERRRTASNAFVSIPRLESERVSGGGSGVAVTVASEVGEGGRDG